MNSKAFLVLIAAALGYLAFVAAHERWDRDSSRPVPETPTDHDLSDVLTPLLTEGTRAISAVRAAVEKRSPDALVFLSRPGEDWQVRVAELLADPPQPPYGRVELAVSEPKGLQIRPRLLLRRELPGSAQVEILAAESGEVLAAFAAQVNQVLALPEDLVLVAGASYVIRATNDPSSGVHVSANFAVIGSEDLSSLQNAMAALKRQVADTRLRIYLQACLAMSQGLDAEATETLMSRLPPNTGNREERGLVERMAYLLDRRGETVARDHAIGILLRD